MSDPRFRRTVYLVLIVVIVVGVPKFLSWYLDTDSPMAAITSGSMWPELKKGDLIYFDENDRDLVLSPQSNVGKSEEKEITIPVDGKSIRRLQREIISAYIKNYRTIILVGEEIKDKAPDIQNTIQNLMALEVMEQTSRKIVARDFLDMNTISIFNLIKKMDNTVRAMIEDCEKSFAEENYGNIFFRDNDVNRISFLIFRIIVFGLDNPSFMYKKHNLTSQNLLNLWWFAFNLETIGDGVKRVARYMRQVNLNKKQQDRFLKLFAESKNGYLQIMKGFLTQDENLAHAVLESKEEFIKECVKFYQDNKNVENASLLVEKLKALSTVIHNLGRVVYQYGFNSK